MDFESLPGRVIPPLQLTGMVLSESRQREKVQDSQSAESSRTGTSDICSQLSCLSLKNLQTLPEIHHPLPGTALPPHRVNARIQSASRPHENQ